jgi:uncharacterized protein YlbG (UPF0298 family)
MEFQQNFKRVCGMYGKVYYCLRKLGFVWVYVAQNRKSLPNFYGNLQDQILVESVEITEKVRRGLIKTRLYCGSI